jgi:hypothetical protein
MTTTKAPTRLQLARESLVKAGFCFIYFGEGRIWPPAGQIGKAQAALLKAGIPARMAKENMEGRDREFLVIDYPDQYITDDDIYTALEMKGKHAIACGVCGQQTALFSHVNEDSGDLEYHCTPCEAWVPVDAQKML